MSKKRLFLYLASFFGMMLLFSTVSYADGDGYIVKMKDDIIMTASSDDDSGLSEISKAHNLYYSASEDIAREYLKNGLAEHIEPDFVIRTELTPTDSLYTSEQWGSKIINTQIPYMLETYGTDVKVAVIDTGCYVEHYDLYTNVLEGFDYINNTTNMTDTDGHGTHVCGIIAADFNGFGVVGVAPKAKILPLRILSGDTGSGAYLIQAIYDAVDKYDCKVINMSLSTPTKSSELENAVNYAISKGVIVVASAGNYGEKGEVDKNGMTIVPVDAIVYPAGYENVISVGAINPDKTLASYSSNNESVWICAPGTMIMSTYPGGYYTYSYLSGTSMAAPMVSAAAAIALSADSALTPPQFKELIKASAQDYNTSSEVIFGNGILDLNKMLKTLLSDDSCYMSPATAFGNVTRMAIWNNSGADLDAILVCSHYDDDGNFLSAETKEIKLSPANVTATPVPSGTNCKYFLWRGYDTIIPLCNPRSFGIQE